MEPLAKSALITGITGQDGSYLLELLLSKGYIVHGLVRRSSNFNTQRIEKFLSDPKVILHYGDVTDFANLFSIIQAVKPDEIYNLAAQSHVKVSFELPLYTAQADGIGVLNILEAVLKAGLSNKCRILQASTSEMFGAVKETPQNENTPFNPQSPYACAKTYAFFVAENYKKAYDMYVVNSICFNHESPRRGRTFVTRKISTGVARIVHGLEDCIVLGNLDAKRDWGHAKDYVEGMWRMLQQEKPDVYVLATGETRTVREFVTKTFEVAGIPITWEGQGVEEVGKDKDGKVRVRVDAKYYRPAEVDLLLGDPSKARQVLHWDTKLSSFDTLVQSMFYSDWAAEL